MLVDGRGRLLSLVLTGGQRGDAPVGEELLKRLPAGGVKSVIADAAYDSGRIREEIKRINGEACIRPNPTRKVKRGYSKSVYRHRNVIERFFGSLKRYRRLATRYEKKPTNFAGLVWLATLLIQYF